MSKGVMKMYENTIILWLLIAVILSIGVVVCGWCYIGYLIIRAILKGRK